MFISPTDIQLIILHVKFKENINKNILKQRILRPLSISTLVNYNYGAITRSDSGVALNKSIAQHNYI